MLFPSQLVAPAEAAAGGSLPRKEEKSAACGFNVNEAVWSRGTSLSGSGGTRVGLAELAFRRPLFRCAPWRRLQRSSYASFASALLRFGLI